MRELIKGVLYATNDYIFYKSSYGKHWIQMRIHINKEEE